LLVGFLFPPRQPFLIFLYPKIDLSFVLSVHTVIKPAFQKPFSPRLFFIALAVFFFFSFSGNIGYKGFFLSSS